jgi:hypothetical protein
MDATSICGFLQINCGVSKADAYQWWKWLPCDVEKHPHRLLQQQNYNDQTTVQW